MSKPNYGTWSVYQRKDGRWVGQKYLGRDGSKQRYTYVTGASEALVRGRIAEREAATPHLFTGSTVAEYLDFWLETFVRLNVAPRSYRAYRDVVERHITPRIGSLPLASVNEAAVRGVLNPLVEAGKLATRDQALTLMRRAFEQAVDDELLAKNPTRKIKVPKGKASPMQVLSPAQLRAFLQQVDRDPLRALYYVGASLGLRNAELRGLRWRDINFQTRQLTVNHQLQYLDGRYRLVEPKSETSKATLTLPQQTYEALAHHYEDEVSRGRGTPDDLVFNRDGQPLAESTLRSQFKSHLRAKGLPLIRLHDLRHTCATVLAAEGLPMKTVQGVLRHSTYQMTANLYAHVVPEMLDRAADVMDGVLEG